MARNPNSDSWNQNHRYSQSDDSIMRRGDDRTLESRDYGREQWQGRGQEQGYGRNSYRTDDYPTDKQMNRGADGGFDRDSSFSSYDGRHQQGWNRGNTNTGNTDSYGWSSDYRSSQDYRPSESMRGDNMRGGSFGSSGYGSNSYGSNMQSNQQSQSQSQFRGQHSGKGPKNYRRSDDRIREEVSEILERDAHIDASELEVEVKEGVVTLRGHVEDRHTKRMTEDLVMAIYGVKDVRNELTVDQSIFTQARNLLFGESAESQAASSSSANRSTATKSKH